MLYKDSDEIIHVAAKLVKDFESTLKEDKLESIFIDHVRAEHIETVSDNAFNVDMRWLIISKGQIPEDGFNPFYVEDERSITDFIRNLTAFDLDDYRISLIAQDRYDSDINSVPDKKDPNYWNGIYTVPFMLKFIKH